MKKSELQNNIYRYQGVRRELTAIYSKLDKAIETGDPTDDLMTRGSELEKAIGKGGPILAEEICKFIQKVWFKPFPLVLDPEQMIEIQGINKSLIDWGDDAMVVKHSLPKFSDKTVNIGIKDYGDHLAFLAGSVKDALKGLRRADTVLFKSDTFQAHFGVSGIRDLFNLIPDTRVEISVDDCENICLKVSARESYILKPFAWDKSKIYQEGYSYNRVLNFV